MENAGVLLHHAPNVFHRRRRARVGARSPGRGLAIVVRQQPWQEQGLQYASPVQDHVIEVHRVQRGTVDVLPHRVDLKSMAIADDRHTVFGVLGGDGAGQHQAGAAQGGIVGVLSGGVGDGPHRINGRKTRLWTSTPARGWGGGT